MDKVFVFFFSPCSYLFQGKDIRAMWPLSSSETDDELSLLRSTATTPPEQLREQAYAMIKTMEKENASCTMPLITDKNLIHSWLSHLRIRLLQS